MKNIFLIIIFLITNLEIMGQQYADSSKASETRFTLKYRQVSGIVQDSFGTGIHSATIKLVSAKDSTVRITDKDGVFIFNGVEMPIFVLTVSEIGFATAVRRYKYNDLTSKIVLSPIMLSTQSQELNPVTVKGTPRIVYKTDTVEYQASDYKVPAYATVDELLKRMEGMEVGRDGSLYHQGQPVTKAKLNGREFGGGNVAQAIQNLPADIVEKIQIADDYGDLAARTGIKNGDPSKTLNITSKSDKSIGTLGTITSKQGNNHRYNENLSVQNINANRVLNLIGNISKTVNGIASSPSTTAPLGLGTGGSSTPGTTQSGSPTLSYTNSWNNKTTITGSYAYSFNNTMAISNSYGKLNSSIGTSDFKRNGISENDSKSHFLKLQIDENVGKFGFLQVNPIFSYNNSAVNSSTSTNNLNYFTTGFEHPVIDILSSSPATSYRYGLSTLFVQTFKKPKRNFSAQLEYTVSNSKSNGEKSADYRYYMDTTRDFLILDSLSHLLVRRSSNERTYRSAITYVEPLNAKSQLEFTAQARNSHYDNKAISDTVLANGQLLELTRLGNIYNYSVNETRVTIDYRYGGRKSNLSLGVSMVPITISGTQLDNNNNQNVSTSRYDFRIIPVFRYAYGWSNTERFQITYSGANNEPNFQQIQPFVDRSDPNNIVVGNPNLKPTFIHSLVASYNKYFPNKRFNISLNVNGRLYDNQVSTNILQVTMPISTSLNRTTNEINYININGDKTVAGRYSLSKLLNNRNYSLVLNGDITYSSTNAISNNSPYHTTILAFNERFGPRISLNDNNLLINPFVGYEINMSSTNTLNASPNTIRTLKLAVDGQKFFLHNFQLHYNASKNFISGLTNYNVNPFVIDAGFEKRLLRRKNLAITFDVFDLLHQNSFIQQSITPLATTYTLSNTASRYFLVGIKLNFQKWGGTPTRDGKPRPRWSDGSFH